MISGAMWLSIILGVTLALLGLGIAMGKIRQAKADDNTASPNANFKSKGNKKQTISPLPTKAASTQKQRPPSTKITQLHAQLTAVMPDLTTTIKHNRIIIEDKHGTNRSNKKQLLLTVDNKLAEGSRQLGDAVVINFKNLPSKPRLEKMLKQYI